MCAALMYLAGYEVPSAPRYEIFRTFQRIEGSTNQEYRRLQFGTQHKLVAILAPTRFNCSPATIARDLTLPWVSGYPHPRNSRDPLCPLFVRTKCYSLHRGRGTGFLHAISCNVKVPLILPNFRSMDFLYFGRMRIKSGQLCIC